MRGDQRACKELYDRYAPMMFGICLRFSRTKSAAEDVLHDGFLKVFSSLDKLRSADSLVNWMHSIMVNTAVNIYRKERLRALPDTERQQTDEDMPYTDNAFDSMDMEFIMETIRQLPPRYRMTFNLCEIEGYSFEEAANILGVEEATIRSNLARAKSILMSKLKPYIE